MATTPPDAVCVAYGFQSSIAAWKFCVFNIFTARHILQDGSPNYIFIFRYNENKEVNFKRMELHAVRNCEFKAGKKYAVSLKIPQ